MGNPENLKQCALTLILTTWMGPSASRPHPQYLDFYYSAHPAVRPRLSPFDRLRRREALLLQIA